MEENNQHADSPAPSPARGRAGINRRTTTTSAVAATAAKPVSRRGRGKPGRGRGGGGRGKGRGRNKTYDDTRVQAAHERQKELKELYSEVASAVKPALEKLAEININRMIDNPTAHKEVAEYQAIQRQLEDQLDARIQSVQRVMNERNTLAKNEFDVHNEISHRKFQNGFNYATEELLDGVANRISILSELFREGAGVNVPDFRYEYVEEPDAVAKDQGPYVVFKDGVEVPYPSLLAENAKASAIRSTIQKKPKPEPKAGPKRKADDVPDGQPDSKKHVSSSTRSGQLREANGEDGSTPRPRHIGGMMSAETELEAEAESNAPSPTPLEEGQSPASEQKGSEYAYEPAYKKDLPDLPTGASEPDTYGVRKLHKRGPKANNRLIIPCQFQFEDGDIGFRDSTNDSSRKATKASRGKFLDKPNSRNWHLDQTIAYYNVLDYEDDELDPEIVKKHKLHPKYGFFLPDSINNSETAGEHDYGVKPIVAVTPDGSTLQAARSVRPMFMDQALKSDDRKNKIAGMLGTFCEELGIGMDEITTDEMREKERDLQDRLLTESEEEAEAYDDEDDGEMEFLSHEAAARAAEDEAVIAKNFGTVLDAAAALEQEERPPVAISTQRASRPYDAVRDVFGTAGSAPQPMPAVVDTFGLSLLADVSETPERYRGPPEMPRVESAMVTDPQVRTAPRQPPPAPSSNAFLQTALNPTPGYAPIAPAPPQNPETRPHTPATRNPFTGQSTGRGSPVLPPLRPAKREKPAAGVMSSSAPMDVQQVQPRSGSPPIPAPPALAPAGPPMLQPGPAPQPQPQPQEFGSPRGMVQTNTGNFYPPAPHRSFHHSFSLHEPNTMIPMGVHQAPPMPPMAPGPPGPPGAGMMYNGPPQPPALAPYPAMSPPLPGHAQLAPMGPSPPIPPSASPPLSANGRQRNSSTSSNGQNAGKYRKIAAAPMAHSRPWVQNGGSELRLSNYDPKGSIKDYTANEPPPRSGPTTIRGWSVNNVSKSRNRGMKKEGSAEDTGSPK
ncbi:hypothetical protein PGQ11_003263 [Apiospora arundinis]|uniref:Uncharacterized protein n=1 Tax=Apiospora arundinis TaxID=335852 RepID=A0ABR2J4N5_9PEZI